MKYFAGLDVSLESTSACEVDEAGRIVWETKVLSAPDVPVEFFDVLHVDMARICLEAGPLSRRRLCEGLADAGLPVVCAQTRRFEAVLSATVNEAAATPAGIAQTTKVNMIRPVHVKMVSSWEKRMPPAQRCGISRPPQPGEKTMTDTADLAGREAENAPDRHHGHRPCSCRHYDDVACGGGSSPPVNGLFAPDLPAHGQALYDGLASGSWQYEGYSYGSDRYAGEFTASAGLIADFETATIAGCIGCKGGIRGVVTDVLSSSWEERPVFPQYFSPEFCVSPKPRSTGAAAGSSRTS